VSGSNVDHVQPVNVMGKSDQPTSELLINTYNYNAGCTPYTSPCNGLVVWALYHGVGSGATLTNVTISTANNYAQPYTAAQPGDPSGSSCAINTGTVGISGGVTWSAGDIYAATTTANFTGNAADGWIFWQVHPTLSTAGAITGATIRTEIAQGLGGFTGDTTDSEYYATPQPDDEGNVTVVYNQSSQSIYPSVAYVSKRTTESVFPDGGIFLTSGTSPAYCQLDSSGHNRWGDYTATSPYGPSIAPYPEFWFAGQYSSGGNWATTIARNGYTSPSAQ
jgi:hypothetical protein